MKGHVQIVSLMITICNNDEAGAEIRLYENMFFIKKISLIFFINIHEYAN